jgi:hypothetical protein
MKSVASIDDDTLYINGWGFGQNQAGTQIPTVDFAEGPEALRHRQGRQDQPRGIDRAHARPIAWSAC